MNRLSLIIAFLLLDCAPAHAQLIAAVLPSSRSVQVGTSATAFATIINSGSVTARACSIAPLTSVPAGFLYQTTDPHTNQPTGTPNTPVDIPAGGARTFVIALIPTETTSSVVVQFSFTCANTAAAPVLTHVNTLVLTADTIQPPDIIAIARTSTGDGIVNIPNPGFFTVAAINIGAAGVLTVGAIDASGAATGRVCVSNVFMNLVPPHHCAPAADAILQLTLATGAAATIVVIPGPLPPGPFDPAADRITLRFLTFGSVGPFTVPSVRGAAGVAVRTQP